MKEFFEIYLILSYIIGVGTVVSVQTKGMTIVHKIFMWMIFPLLLLIIIGIKLSPEND